MHYVFGYGSLLSTVSRERTARTGPAVPGRLLGVRRAWNVFSAHSKTVFLGLVEAEDSCPGAFYAVDDEGLAALDAREKNYTRIRVPRARVEADLLDDAIVWTYMPEPQVTVPVDGLLVSPRYLEVVQAGAAEIGQDWEEFVATTDGWDLVPMRSPAR